MGTENNAALKARYKEDTSAKAVFIAKVVFIDEELRAMQQKRTTRHKRNRW